MVYNDIQDNICETESENSIIRLQRERFEIIEIEWYKKIESEIQF